jgi:outer membrane protein OmpA-like peptidoglycan-associated protein
MLAMRGWLAPVTSLVLLSAALAIGGCASVAPPAAPAPVPGKAPAPAAPAPPAPPASADQRAAAPAVLATERAWLQSWFKGTPVLIAQRSDGTITIDVPLEFCFDPGRSAVKPALAAVLSKVAESMKRVPLTRLPVVAAPDDGIGRTPLALQRAQQVHKQLLANGVPAARMGPPTAAATAAVLLRIDAAPL